MNDCIFCKIIKGEIPCCKIYEDDDILAFLDVNPLSKGHTLVLPKKHFENIFDIPDELLCKVNTVAKKISIKINEKYRPEGIVINQNNGIKAGQSIFHFHIHIKPIYEDTFVVSEKDGRKQLSKEEMEKIVNELRI